MPLTNTARIMEHCASRVQRGRQLADIYSADGQGGLAPLKLFQKGATIIKKGYVWKWVVPGSFDIPVKRVSKDKFELILQ